MDENKIKIGDVIIVTGQLNHGKIGTVTEILGDRVYANVQGKPGFDTWLTEVEPLFA